MQSIEVKTGDDVNGEHEDDGAPGESRTLNAQMRSSLHNEPGLAVMQWRRPVAADPGEALYITLQLFME